MLSKQILLRKITIAPLIYSIHSFQSLRPDTTLINESLTNTSYNSKPLCTE